MRIKGPIHQTEDVSAIKCMPLTRAPKYMRQKLTKAEGETDNTTVTGRDFNTPFSVTARTTREMRSKEMEDSTQNQTSVGHCVHLQENTYPSENNTEGKRGEDGI